MTKCEKLLPVLCLLVTSLLLTHCSDKPATPVLSEGLIGSWQWLQSCGGFTGHCLTPDSLEYEKMITLSADSMFYSYRDDSLLYMRAFTVTEMEVWGHDTADVLLVYGLKPAMIIGFSGSDTLWLTDHCYDCYNHCYLRLSAR